MFQYAAGRALASRLKVELLLDVSPFREYSLRSYELGKFQIRARDAGLWHRLKHKTRLFGKRFQERAWFHYDKKFAELEGHVYLDGYFQHPLYIQDVSLELTRDFTLQDEPPETVIDVFSHIDSVNAVSLHVRRGDYVTNPDVGKFLPLCTQDYYQRAAERMAAQVENPVFVLFSDDIPWVKSQLALPFDSFLVDTGSVHHDLLCMSQCRHHIIANSSLSWWGAWLKPRADKIVIGPEPWALLDGEPASPMPGNWQRIKR
jgi:Glycosyl transferase family 11